jgi:NAD(P)-dependent dehydrogenase (short-subunit alcohol dehydrogenase family)
MTDVERREAADMSDVPVRDLLSLDGRVAVVTGGAQGIGFAIASRFVEAGAAVAIADLNESGAVAAAERLAGPGVRTAGLAVDVTDSASVESAAALVTDRLGPIDVWVNNAGIFPTAPMLEMSDEMWDAINSVNLRGMFFGGREAGRRMRAHGRGGVIVNLASTSGHAGFGPGLAAYTSSKHGVLGLTKAQAIELGPLGVRVVALSPQVTLTEGVAAAAEEFADTGVADVNAAVVAKTPLGRVGVPDDIARVALFAASDAAIFVTGSVIPVDGGLLAVG